MTMKELLALIVQWGVDRGFPTGGTVQGQALKLAEEWGKEACANLLASDLEKFKDDVGDQVVVLVMMGLSNKVDPSVLVDNLSFVLRETTGSALAQSFWYSQDKSTLPGVHVYQMFLGQGQKLGAISEAVVKGYSLLPLIREYAESLQSFCDYVGVNVFESMQVAYEQIKDRKGTMINGSYIKESDLPASDLQTSYEG